MQEIKPFNRFDFYENKVCSLVRSNGSIKVFVKKIYEDGIADFIRLEESYEKILIGVSKTGLHHIDVYEPMYSFLTTICGHDELRCDTNAVIDDGSHVSYYIEKHIMNVFTYIKKDGQFIDRYVQDAVKNKSEEFKNKLHDLMGKFQKGNLIETKELFELNHNSKNKETNNGNS